MTRTRWLEYQGKGFSKVRFTFLSKFGSRRGKIGNGEWETRAGLVRAADLVGAADGSDHSSQKGSPNFGRGRPPATGWVPAVVRRMRRRQRRPKLPYLPGISAKRTNLDSQLVKTFNHITWTTFIVYKDDEPLTQSTGIDFVANGPQPFRSTSLSRIENGPDFAF